MLGLSPVRVALVTVYSHDRCTLKDVAGGYGTVFDVGPSWPARILAAAKVRLCELPSTTMGYLAAQLRAAGHEVSVHDLSRTGPRRDPVPGCDAALVQTSMVDASAEREVLAELTSAGVHTIAFGAYASARPEVFSDVARVVVTGEPEVLGARLLERRPSGIVDAGFVDDLDSLPYPDWSPFPVARYRYALLSRRGATLPVASARGCAFGCGYCPFRVTSPFRERRPERVVDEVRQLCERHGARGISFRDPLFNHDRERVAAIAHGIAPLGVRFSAEMRADLLDEALLTKLHGAGLRSLEIGVESARREMLVAEGRRPASHDQIEGILGYARRLGIRVVANFILGLPEDSEASILETVAWAKRLNPFAVQFTVATPYPGTTLERRARAHMTTDSPEACTGFEPVFEHPTIDADRIRQLREWAYVSYHARPRYVWRFARQAASTLFD